MQNKQKNKHSTLTKRFDARNSDRHEQIEMNQSHNDVNQIERISTKSM